MKTTTNPTPNFKLDDLRLNSSFVLYKKTRRVPKRLIEEYLRPIANQAIGRRKKRFIREEIILPDQRIIHISGIVCQIETCPQIFANTPYWLDPKTIHSFILELDGYVGHIYKSAPSLDKLFREHLQKLPYHHILRNAQRDAVHVDKFVSKKMDSSRPGLKREMREASQLEQAVTAFALSHQVLSSVKFETSLKQTLSVLPNSARITMYGAARPFYGVCENFAYLVDLLVEEMKHLNVFTDLFAEPTALADLAANVRPVAIGIYWTYIQAAYAKDEIREVVLSFQGRRSGESFIRVVDFDKFLIAVQDDASGMFNLSEVGEKRFDIVSDNAYQISLNRNLKRLTLRGPRRNGRFQFVLADGEMVGIEEYITKKHLFAVWFSDPRYFYTGRSLFLDRRLTNQWERLFDIIETVAEFEECTSEKGKPEQTAVTFPEDSLFGQLVHYYTNRPDNCTLVCDDMGTEFCDWIVHETNAIHFIHAKHKSKDSTFSASDWQDVIGQCQKNLGTVRDHSLLTKRAESKWLNTWGSTDIPRTSGAVGCTRELIDYNERFNAQRRIVIAFSSVSAGPLRRGMEKVCSGRHHVRSTEITQIMWFLWSFIHNCQTQSFQPIILCRP